MTRDIIALDADGVLLDFHRGYAGAWQRAFGSLPAGARSAGLLADGPLARRPPRGRRAPRPLPQALRRGVLDLRAGHRGRDRGVPSAARRRLRSGLRLRSGAPFEAARLRNLRDHGFPIERVIATGNVASRSQPEGRRDRRAESRGLRRRLPSVPARRAGACAHRAHRSRPERQPRTSAPNSRSRARCTTTSRTSPRHWLSR